VSERSLADGPGFDNMVVGSLVRLGQSFPREIARELSEKYKPVSYQAVAAALARSPHARRHPTGTWSVR